MTKALTLDEAREELRAHFFDDACGALETFIRAVARQEIAALSDGDRTRADDVQVDGAAEQRDAMYGVPISEDTNPYVFMTSGDMREALRSRDATIADLERRLTQKEKNNGAD